MKKIVLSLLSLLSPALFAQAPAASEDIMLQGFYWNSQPYTSWAKLLPQTATLGESFTLIWLPPSASPEGGGTPGGTNVGYHPREWTNQTSCWGTAAELQALTTAFHKAGVKVVADIVINHRAGATGWGDFTADNFGEKYGNYQLTAAHICSNDEMNTDPSAGSWKGLATGAPDTGENWGGARDLDHTSAYVQADCKAYLSWLLGEMGYDGFRYDFVKGFGGEYVGIYNAATKPYLSVGEYWDGSYDNVNNWIKATGYESMAFDFPMKYAALNDGLAKGNYSTMSWIEDNTTWRPAGLIHHASTRRYAVTFVDNHDTYRDQNRYTGDIPQAYAFLFSSAGVPCVFWPHWQQYQSVLKQQMACRRKAGLTSESNVEVTARSTYYEAHATGLRGSLICRIGAAAPTDVPSGYVLAAKGTGWQYFLSENVAGIKPVVADEASSAVYTLDGRRAAEAPTSGVYIKDGKKHIAR